MNRLNQLFNTKKQDLLSIYFTAGYPALNTTVDIAEALEKAGADFLEVGSHIQTRWPTGQRYRQVRNRL
jgi:tryptophan synthase alpha chain